MILTHKHFDKSRKEYIEVIWNGDPPEAIAHSLELDAALVDFIAPTCLTLSGVQLRCLYKEAERFNDEILEEYKDILANKIIEACMK